MKKLIFTLAFAGLAASTALHAQTSDAKTDMAAKVVKLEQGPELDRLIAQLAGSTTQELIATWGPRMETNVAKANQQKVSEALNAELKKYSDDTNQLITKQVPKISTEVLVPAYAERFTLEELQQIAAFFESPAVQKYQANSPELGNAFVQKLIDASRTDVLARAKQFDAAAFKIVGGPAPKASQPAKK